MAGFIEKLNKGFLNFGISDKIKTLTDLGIRYNDQVLKQSKALGWIESQVMMQNDIPPEVQLSLAMSDTTTTGSNKQIAIFDKEYPNRREFLRKFSLNGEVEWCLDTICDECICYDDNNFFCEVNVDNINSFLKDDIAAEVKTSLEVNFKRIYTYFGFQQGASAWQLFKQWLVEGFLAFEIIYNEEETSIIGFKQLDPSVLERRVIKTFDGYRIIWVEHPENNKLMRELSDSQVIYISYAKGNFVSRISYLENLVRSHNLLRLMEHTRVIWNIMNATFRLKIIVPVGSNSRQRGQENLNELLAKFKEDIYLDYDSGELQANGKAAMQFHRNYLLPKKDGDSPEIETLAGDGPELQDTQIIDFFWKKFKIDSKIPFGRWSRDGSATFTLSAEIDQEERAFSKLKTRFRAMFSEILIKPILLQMSLDHPDLKDNEMFISSLKIKYHQDADFEELKQIELMGKKIDFINNLSGINDNISNEPYFSTEFLIRKYLGLSDSDLALNKELNAKPEESTEKEEF